ncbi:hypothetical protein M0R19_08185 [Candidatus Pacearchaeota archaeon]|jgi:hypothetical protein|nr:hypothetical protein [bacterium]MCK9597136.1 hypothetical protein [Candidatus Pacearchaeota archaeon]
MPSDYKSMQEMSGIVEFIHKDFITNNSGSKPYLNIHYNLESLKLILSCLLNGSSLDYTKNKIESAFKCGSDEIPFKVTDFLPIIKAILALNKNSGLKPNDNIKDIEVYCKNELDIIDSNGKAIEKQENADKSEYLKGREDVASEILEIIEESKETENKEENKVPVKPAGKPSGGI